MNIKSTLCLLGLGIACLTQPALADHDHHDGDPYWRRDDGGWHGDIHHFHEHDVTVWRGGNWYHGHHDGRDGWWWIVNGLWYFYAAPVYPYPDPYTPAVVVTAPQVAAPAPPAQVWYYCRNPAGYYPYVPACRHWEMVPAQP
ncbi:MAG: hypothetical protein JO171_12485 [Paludibacterium sp.]|uniref:hypothetical protein n=1 Tax=Paludibacterium sp. TaxID=1917523 RepID=UPI0025FFC926|nr:hypothetical protein [Paludibacterium sp.]MBV8047970.1 hypothetical protein [Paludibacterium sp.]MBV8649138.1 hypothetical protein [Paludibacterium sp.]